ncbi:hypothetical protein FRC17_004275, partial [Serendipita sp. 399]
VRKVIQFQKIHNAFNPGGIGAEPGIDPRRPGSDAAYGHIKEPCEIEVIDYSATNYEIQQYDNSQFKAFIEATRGRRPDWAKSLADKEASASPLANVQPHGPSHNDAARSKSPQQMTAEEEKGAEEQANASTLRRRKKANDVDIEKGVANPKRKHSRQKYRSETEERRLETEKRIKHTEEANEKLRNTEYSVKVVTKGLFLYLLRDGTVISVHSADRGFGDPIYRRLQTPNTILRASADPSLLIEALLDLVVDRALDIVDRFHENILACERSILLKPKMNTVRELHFLSAELSARRRALDPVKTLIYGLRRYDQERCVAIAESSGSLVEGEKIQGFLSHKSKIYLADVHEHCEWILTSLEMFENITENLINYTGMNFAEFKGVSAHSDAFFWEIAAPVFVLTVIVFLWHDLVRVAHYIRKKVFLQRY